MARTGMNSAQYETVRETPAYILIRDVGPWSEHPTVTNDAENVVEELAAKLGTRRLLYYDSEGELNELKHVGTVFTGFAFVKSEENGQPVISEGKCLNGKEAN